MKNKQKNGNDGNKKNGNGVKGEKPLHEELVEMPKLKFHNELASAVFLGKREDMEKVVRKMVEAGIVESGEFEERVDKLSEISESLKVAYEDSEKSILLELEKRKSQKTSPELNSFFDSELEDPKEEVTTEQQVKAIMLLIGAYLADDMLLVRYACEMGADLTFIPSMNQRFNRSYVPAFKATIEEQLKPSGKKR